MKVETLSTPCLLLDRARLERNCARMSARADALGVSLRPHMKTAKSVEAARIALRGRPAKVTVSTVAEARLFTEAGIGDITLAVAATPDRMAQVAPLVRAGASINIICDDLATAARLAAQAAALEAPFGLLIEINTGENRGGLEPDSPVIAEIGRLATSASHLRLHGVLTHAGHSYRTDDHDDLVAIAEQERAGAIEAARLLIAAGIPCPTVSVGSTPTVMAAATLDGVTEVRPGVYMLMDLDQWVRGLCRRDDIAVSVLATVIGHSSDGRAIIDAGALALSKDLGAAARRSGIGYGVVERIGGTASDENNLFVAEAYQEHGMVEREGGGATAGSLPIGARVRVVPNHACITSAAHTEFVVLDGERAAERWPRTRGWG